jgi:hypothetical protein
MTNKQIIDILLGVTSLIFWFQPFNSVSFGNDMFQGSEMYQSGEHIGGLAYLMLILPVVFAYFSWQENHQFKLISGGTQLLLCVIFLIPRLSAGNVKYGIIILTFLAVAMIVRSLPQFNQPNE